MCVVAVAVAAAVALADSASCCYHRWCMGAAREKERDAQSNLEKRLFLQQTHTNTGKRERKEEEEEEEKREKRSLG